jgi:hypothetical protein
MGPAWLKTQDARGHDTEEPCNNGEWISRMNALSLANAHGYTVSIDY